MYPNVISTIPIDIIIFIRKRLILDTSMNMENIVILPKNDPNSNLFKSVCRLKIIPVAKRSNKSNPKFNKRTKST